MQLHVSYTLICYLKGPIQPHIRQFFLNTIRLQPLVQVFEIHKIEMLILVEAGEDEEFFAGVRVMMRLWSNRWYS